MSSSNVWGGSLHKWQRGQMIGMSFPAMWSVFIDIHFDVSFKRLRIIYLICGVENDDKVIVLLVNHYWQLGAVHRWVSSRVDTYLGLICSAQLQHLTHAQIFDHYTNWYTLYWNIKTFRPSLVLVDLKSFNNSKYLIRMKFRCSKCSSLG